MVSPRRSPGSLERDVRLILTAHRRAMTPTEVRDALGGALAYTTVMTVLTRLHDKGEVTRHPVGRGYAYAAQDPAELTARRMQRLLDAEDADRAAVLMRFVGTLGPDDEHLLRTLLATREAQAQ
jgi:predicted transcriptional regulator